MLRWSVTEEGSGDHLRVKPQHGCEAVGVDGESTCTDVQDQELWLENAAYVWHVTLRLGYTVSSPLQIIGEAGITREGSCS